MGRSVANGLLVLNYAPSADGEPHFGFITGKKVGGAVVRNRVKRRLREQLRRYHEGARLRPGLDIVVVARSEGGRASGAQLREALDELLTRAHLWQKEENR